ncbi:DUF6297 family protein [Microbispora catharanthi]|uniref:Uncharacterized protein n=1 Tax=Microbispora catharanthi TaxID=1712871 RepID=A0A5N6BW86_9ACTN|nr:DUF6297 family protein [Microbispora catharanthi]KAB8184570.1 hypothetical protein FH610_015885 [Microbispora catharanthi]
MIPAAARTHPALAYLRARRGRPATFSDRYTGVFGLLVAAAVLGRPVAEALAGLAHHADPARLGPGLALVAAAYAGFLALARALGPVVLPAADASWLVTSPLPRRAVLGRTALLLLSAAVLAGAALGLTALSVFGAPDQLGVRLAAALVLGVAAGVGGMATAVLGQQSPASDARLQFLIAGALSVAVLAAVLGAGPGRRILAAVAEAPASLGVAAAGVASVVAAFLVRQAWTALARIPAHRILASSTRTARVTSAATTLDPGMLTWVAEDAHWRGRALRSRPWPRLLSRLGPAPALAWQEWLRVGRRPGRLAALLGAAALPAVCANAIGGGSGAAGMLLCGALTAAAMCTGGVRRDGGDPALARMLAVDGRAATAARAVLPALLAASWSALALVGLQAAGTLPAGAWWALGPAAAPALAAGALRMARRRPVDHSMPVIDTPGGAVPTGPLIWALTGVDLALFGSLPALSALASRPASVAPYVAAQAVAGAAVLAAYILRPSRGNRP